jgi:hypothetical protein
MFQICMFGGYEGRLQTSKRVFLTIFGSCELHRQTLARQLLARRSAGQPDRAGTHRNVVVTLFGATEIKAPTLAEEFIDLKDAIRSGALSRDAWDSFASDLAASESESVFSLTLFAGFSEAELPSENEEVDSLAIQRHLGNISDSALQVLQLGVGQNDAQRRAVLRQAIAASA